MDPLTPMMGAVGGIGRTPIPVAESMHHPGERPLTPVGKHKRERPDQKGETQLLHQTREGPLKKLKVIIREGNLNGHCLNPQTHIDLREERWEKRRYPLQDTQRWDEGPSEQEYPTPNRQLIEADMKRRRRLAALARDHIMKLREE